ncbi:MAG: hypothetical protein CVV64_17445 [Candidatus Wallbacteria bacterium HGW-Wallbacteria-1]|uniref:Transposase n=1 Tax=Candidatus Wallbacteria bacterium HGW-Wallbacteria-1 TaxID=2013854 RepID=A0A2N1PKH8_9BACT|nr:MAG: hypothetical protein CVV64_17445 [Candidatus Wallbacteria bacterium HGW-Wallbacteria-1]
MLAEAIKLHEEKLIAEAMLQGKLQGLEEGELKGKLEGKLEIAKNMLRAGISASQIVELTGLSLDEVSKLSH